MKDIAGFTIFRNERDLNLYLTELGFTVLDLTDDVPPFPFAGRAILDDFADLVAFITITPTQALNLGLALN